MQILIYLFIQLFDFGKRHMKGTVLVLGYGAVGKATTELLMKHGRDVVVAQRKKPSDLPSGVAFKSCDVLDAAALDAALKDVNQVVVALGFAYDGKLWRDVWPRAMANLLQACSNISVRVVFVDNLYMYGEQNQPLREDMPLTNYGAKPALRAEITNMWMAASKAGKVKIAALRASDFYGPGALLSHFGDASFGALTRGKSAQLVVAPDVPHDFTYVPDIARAVVSLLDAPDDAFGQAWHVPNAPIKTPREILDLAANSIGKKAKISALPSWMLPIIGLFVPMLREFSEIKYQLNKPYRVDTTKFGKRFWSDATPFEVGVPLSVKSFQGA